MTTLPAGLRERFEVRRALGRGAFGEVHEVRRREDGAILALKLVRVQGDGRREARELEAARRVEHPNLLRCHETGAEEGMAYLLLELADGSLAGSIRDPARLEQAWGLLVGAARGVAALHRAELIHRDLKPENVLVVGGAARVADLGLAKGRDLKTVTRTGMVLGTPGYMAPEQALGTKLTPAADVFALGVMAYEALEGRRPYPDLPPVEILHRVAEGRLEPFRRARRRLAPGELATLEAALEVDPAARPGDLSAWADALAAMRPWESPRPDGDEKPERTARVPASSLPSARRPGAATTRKNRRTQRLPLHLLLVPGLALAIFLAWSPSPPAPTPVARDTVREARDLRARLGELLHELQEERAFQDLLETSRGTSPESALEAWHRARRSFRDRVKEFDLQRQAGLPEREAYSQLARISLLERVLTARKDREIAPLHEPGEDPGLESLLGRDAEFRLVPEISNRSLQWQGVEAELHRRLEQDGRRWARLRGFQDLLIPGTEDRPVIDQRLGVLDPTGTPLPQLVQDHAQFMGLLREDVLARKWDNPLAMAAELHLRPLRDGDLFLALTGYFWLPSRPMLLELEGWGGRTSVVLTLPPPPTPAEGQARRVGGIVRVARRLLPEGCRRLRITARGLARVAEASPTVGLEQVYQLLEGPPPFPESPRVPAAPGTDPARWFTERYPRDVEAELDRLSSRTLATGEPFLDRDFVRWGAMLLELPEVLRFHRWLVAGGDPAALPEALRDGLEQVDQRFRKLELPRPFWPALYTRRPAGGWWALAKADQQRLHDMREEKNREVVRAFRGEPSSFPYSRLKPTLRNILAPDAHSQKGLLGGIHVPMSLRPGRLALASWLREGTETYQRMTHAVARALREDPARAEEWALEQFRMTGATSPFLCSHAAFLAPELLRGLAAGSPAERFHVGVLLWRQGQARQDSAGDGGLLRERAYRLFLELAGEAGDQASSPLARTARTHARRLEKDPHRRRHP